MTEQRDGRQWWTEQAVQEDLERQPHLMLRLAENALTVAQSLRDNYFHNTSKFISDLRRAIAQTRKEPLLTISAVDDLEWSSLSGEVVTFIDGGVGQVRVSSQVPILLRVGSYRVRVGDRQLAQREDFGYYPVILGDLQGGSKERRDFIDIVRITAELLGGLSALERTPDLSLLMFHGPLTYLVGAYAGHVPFTEADIDIFLHQYGVTPCDGRDLKAAFLDGVAPDLYPRMNELRGDVWIQKRLFEPLSWMAFLYRRLVSVARSRTPTPIIAGVVERGALREFSEHVLLPRIFRGLRENKKADHFNQLFGRSDLTSPKRLLDRLGYTDALLLAMILEPGQCTETWLVNKFGSLRHGMVPLPDESSEDRVDFSVLKPGASEHAFPKVLGCYVHVSETTEPIRVEVFEDLGIEQVREAVSRTLLYARLLPGYGFPVGLNIADQHAKVPSWLTEAYGKLIRLHLSESLQRGEISDAQLRRILVQAIYMTHRDWLFRPQA